MLDAKNLHHAYIVEGDIQSLMIDLKQVLGKEDRFKLVANPDVYERVYDGFGIEDAREINDMLLAKPLGSYKIFLLGVPSMTGQAGNALLKSLEEPPLDTHLFIFTPNSKRMLPTLLSRVVLINKDALEAGTDVEISSIEISGSDFLKMPSVKRMDEVKKIMGDYDKEKISKSDIIRLMDDIIQEYRKNKKRDDEALKKALTAYDYAGDQSSSLKILLEYMALIL